jgi:hypothetical protein
MKWLIHYAQLIPWGVVVGFAGKLFIEAAATMPPPLSTCGFWKAWAFDLIQSLAANKNRVGERQKA